MWLFLNTCTFLTQIYAFWNIPEMTHPSLHLNEQFHFYFLLTEVCLPILNIPYSESYFDFSAKSLATEYWTGELSPDRRVHGSRPKKGKLHGHWESVVWKKMRLNSITTYLDGISQPNITLKVHSTLMSNWNFLILNYTMLGNISSTF